MNENMNNNYNVNPTVSEFSQNSNMNNGPMPNPGFNSNMNNGPMPNPGFNPNMNNGPMPNPGFNPNMNNEPMPNPGFNPNMNNGPMPNPGFNSNMNNEPMPNPGFNPNMNNEPMPNPGFNPNMNNGPMPNPGFNPNMNQGPMPNPGFNPNMRPRPNNGNKKGIIIGVVAVVVIAAIVGVLFLTGIVGGKTLTCTYSQNTEGLSMNQKATIKFKNDVASTGQVVITLKLLDKSKSSQWNQLVSTVKSSIQSQDGLTITDKNDANNYVYTITAKADYKKIVTGELVNANYETAKSYYTSSGYSCN